MRARMMAVRAGRGLLSALTLIGAAATAFAAKAGPDDAAQVPPASAEITVALIQLEVRAEDRKGNFVPGLATSDFVLLEDGEPRTIEYADEVRRGGAEAGVPPAPAATPTPGDTVSGGRGYGDSAREASVALVLDGANSSPSALQRQIPYLASFIRSLSADTHIAVYDLRPDGALQVRSDYTRERADSLAAIERARGTGGETDRGGKLQELESILTEKLSLCGRDREATMCRESAFETGIHIATGFATEEQGRSRRAIESLRTVATLASRMEGARTVVVVSEGVDPGGASYFSALAKLIRQVALMSGVRDTDRWVQEVQRDASPFVAEGTFFTEVQRAASASGVTFYWVNPSHSGGYQPMAVEGSLSAWQVGQDFINVPDPEERMEGLATDTGGLALVRAAGIEKFYDRVARDVENYYLLSYTPSGTGEGKTHKIEVRVSRPDVKVRLRERSVEASPEMRVARDLARALDFPEDRNDFAIATRELWLRAGDGYQVFLHVAVPYAELRPTPRGDVLEDIIKFGFVVRDPDGELVKAEEGEIAFRPTSVQFAQAQQAQALLDYRHRLDLPPGRYAVSIAVLDTAARRSASVRLPLELPSGRARCLAMSPLLLARAVEKTAERVEEVRFDPRGEILYGDHRMSFGAVAVLPPSGTLAGLYQVLDPRRGADGSLSVAVRFRLRQGDQVVSETTETALRSPASPDAKVVTNFFSVPYKALAAGSYRLELVARDSAGSCEAVSGADFRIAGAASSSRPADPRRN